LAGGGRPVGAPRRGMSSGLDDRLLLPDLEEDLLEGDVEYLRLLRKLVDLELEDLLELLLLDPLE